MHITLNLSCVHIFTEQFRFTHRYYLWLKVLLIKLTRIFLNRFYWSSLPVHLMIRKVILNKELPKCKVFFFLECQCMKFHQTLNVEFWFICIRQEKEAMRLSVKIHNHINLNFLYCPYWVRILQYLRIIWTKSIICKKQIDYAYECKWLRIHFTFFVTACLLISQNFYSTCKSQWDLFKKMSHLTFH